jgi:poly(3-hydroxybutyrate) depolymerase
MKHLTHAILLTALAGCEQPSALEPLPLEFRVAPSSGCTTASTASGTFSVAVGAGTRNYRIDAPPGWNGTDPLPVVYTFHACGGNEQNGSWNSLWARTNQSQWLAPDVTPYNVLVVNGDAAGTCWDVVPTGTDLEYYDALRTAVESTYCVDEERRYHAGVSSGGFAAQAFACRRDGVAAVWAGLSGIHHATNPYGLTVHPLPAATDCNGPVAVFGMASSTDTLVPPNTYSRPARDVWLDVNDCDPLSATPYSHRIPGADNVAGAGLGNVCTGHVNCACSEYTCAGARTVWCEYEGSGGNGHGWPGYYRDGAANWLGRFTEAVDEGGSSSSGDPNSSSGAGEVSSNDSSTTCEMVCQCL